MCIYSKSFIEKKKKKEKRKTAYSNDLRWRIVYQRIAMNLLLMKIAQKQCIVQTFRL